MWGAVFLLTVAGTAIADPNAIFLEDATRMSGSRIVSGWEAEPGQFPHQLSLRMVSPAGGVFSCGGSILNDQWGLTAAHCTANRVTIVVRAGATNLTQPALIFETSKYYNHPRYSEADAGTVQPNDIGLIEFGRSIKFNELIQPIRIQNSADKDRNYEAMQAIASGWGRTWTGGTSPENLNWVNLRLVSTFECRMAYGGSAIIADSTICTRGYDNPTQSTCQGDSGGPLTIIDDDGAITQVGVASFVHISGCHTGVPSGFIRPGHYHDWFYEVSGYSFDWEFEIEEPVTTEHPEPETTVASEEETTVASEEDTTDAPEEDTTDAPEEDTTNAPEEDTTDASREDTTEPSVEDVPSEESAEPATSSQSSESSQSSASSESSE